MENKKTYAEVLTVKNLTKEQREKVSDWLEEWDEVLVIRSAEGERFYDCNIEPEDVRFYRDLRYVPLEINKAYEQGWADALKSEEK